MRRTLRPEGEQPDGQRFGLVLLESVGSLGCGRECEDCVESKGIMETDAKVRVHLPGKMDCPTLSCPRVPSPQACRGLLTYYMVSTITYSKVKDMTIQTNTPKAVSMILYCLRPHPSTHGT